MSFQVVLRIVQRNVALLIHHDAIVGIRKVLRGQPKIDRVLRHDVEGHARRERWRARSQGLEIRLAQHLDVAQGKLPVFGLEVEIVHSKGLLKCRGIRPFGQRQHGRVVVAHVVSADDVGRIGQPLGVLVVRRAQQECRRVDSAAGDNHDVSRIFFPNAVALDMDLFDLPPGRARFQTGHQGVRQ